MGPTSKILPGLMQDLDQHLDPDHLVGTGHRSHIMSKWEEGHSQPPPHQLLWMQQRGLLCSRGTTTCLRGASWMGLCSRCLGCG